MRVAKSIVVTLILVIFSFTQLEAKLVSPFLNNKKKKPTVCLNMIVKNEKDVITRCLKSVLPIIDYWVIVDTGSTDGTQQIIIDFMKENNVPGELHEQPWVNFEHNREEALVLAKFKADYILFMDADDILTYDENFKLPNLVFDCYLIKSRAGGTEYMITRMVKASLDWHWHGVLHEYVSSDRAKKGAVLNGVTYIYICDGARARDPNKAKKDVKILSDALEKEPDNARYMFYLAQSYVTDGDYENGLKHYMKRVEMGGWEEEVFWSMLQIAHLHAVLKHDRKEIESWFVKALKYRPSRPEPYYYLINSARIDGHYDKGYELGRMALNLPPCKDILFVEAKTYDAVLVEFAICALMTGHIDESLSVTDRLLAKKDLAPPIEELTLQCRMQAMEKMKEQSILHAVDEIFSEI